MNLEFWHDEIMTIDLIKLHNQLEGFDEFYTRFNIAIAKAKQTPFRQGWDLKYDLEGWHEYQFFSAENPPEGVKPDMRLVYSYDRDYQIIYILAVGLRNSKERRISDDEHSIYFIAKERLETIVKDDWTLIKKS